MCLATLMSSDRTKQICLWMTIYIYIYSLSVDDNIYIYVYIVIYRQTVSLYHNSSVWLDTRDDKAEIEIQLTLRQLDILLQKLSSLSAKAKEF